MNAPRLGERAWYAVGALLALLIVLAAWFVVVGPTRSDAADLRESAANVQTQNDALVSKLATLKREAEQRTQLAADVKKALDALPPGTNLPVFSRQVTAQATHRGVDLTGFAVGSATTPGSAVASTTTSPVLAIPVTITSTGPALAQLYFLRDLQQDGPRLALVNSTSLAPGQGATDSGSIVDSSTLTVQLTVFTRRLPSTTRDQLAGLLGDATN